MFIHVLSDERDLIGFLMTPRGADSKSRQVSGGAGLWLLPWEPLSTPHRCAQAVGGWSQSPGSWKARSCQRRRKVMELVRLILDLIRVILQIIVALLQLTGQAHW